MKTISISNRISGDIRTRSFFRRDLEQILQSDPYCECLDFSDVAFISRSVADEICNILDDYPQLRVEGMRGDVKAMYEIVVKGRKEPREYPEEKIKVVHLSNMRELSAFLESF